ncbi:hypothetical protein BCR43DRAFT_487969 [Syncephalastrum racemosum]|uniref:AAA+ ATPase domain-containing protein n=1 Tax=Syncephalastrum racemosum TaxID=13706 RepID=A0A1X2HHV7_SYNRA|nr:hypothetical protein BCR43DRAFT_487969 [Syncephalastrum racemosum]
MPFLLNFVNQIQHSSALQLYTSQTTVSIPFDEIQSQFETQGRALHLGDKIEVAGKPGSGKTLLLKRIAQQSQHTAVYIDFDHRLRHAAGERQQNLHLFEPATPTQLLATVLGLDAWLHAHPEKCVTWVILDGCESYLADVLEPLHDCQARWGFVLAYTVLTPTESQSVYRLQLSKEGGRFYFQLNMPSRHRTCSTIAERFVIDLA